jgi:anti-sigma factor RsiW
MTVSREIILDLLPLYYSDEASPDTRALIEEHLDHDPDLAQLAGQWKERLPASPPAPVNPDAQALAYSEAKRQIANRVITVAAVVAIGTLALAAAAMIGAMFLIGM